MWSAMDHPTIRLEKTSRMAAQYTLPSLVGCSVMSVHHSWSGRSAEKLRCTKSS
jgi:hypothetical protein